MRAKFKPWAKPFIENNSEFICFEDSLETSKKFLDFLKKDNLSLEIGPGKGMFIIEMAKKHPEINFICIEKNLSISAVCAKNIKSEDLHNIFVVSGDIFNVFKFFQNELFESIFLNHSDPWPKKRHEKRRLTHPSFLNEYKRILKKDGTLIVKTDNDGMFDYSLESISNNNWNIEHITYDYNGDDEFDASTNYELNFREKNVPIKRLKAKKK